jgi:tRNA 5-methylaminomethyl-2-thiouridine biosynthesis bifunctional protein
MERVDWGADGTPRSPRFDDIYRPASLGLAQARHVFLHGCGLPEAWAHRERCTILETGFGLGLNFLATWRAWKDDPQRPRLLHFVSIEAFPVAGEDIERSASAHEALRPLASELARQWYGLTPGVHRLSFEGGRVLLTLCIGDVQAMLAQLAPFRANGIFLDGFDPQRNPRMWTPEVMRAVARFCRRGTRAATWTVAADLRRALAQCGFQVEKAQGLAPKRDCLRAVYDPEWEPKGLKETPSIAAGSCAVIGAGLAGSAAAASLARRSWQVTVFDASDTAASGASSLPAGLVAPHQSPDDNLLSRLTRAGVRCTLQEARARLVEGRDWERSGVLEFRGGDVRDPADVEALSAWTRIATREERADALLAEGANAWWHETAAWIKPSALVHAWLGDEGIAFVGSTAVGAPFESNGRWGLQTTAGVELGSFDLVVVAAANASRELLAGRIGTTPVRGQVTWSRSEGLPPFPMNGNGHFLPRVPLEEGVAWLSGSTYARGDASTGERAEDHAANLQRLRELSPGVAAQLEVQFASGEVRAWTGVRCASRDRRPLVGEIEPGLWVATAMGSRGLTFAVLCAELLAARLHGEPMPVERKLAEALDAVRGEPGRSSSPANRAGRR